MKGLFVALICAAVSFSRVKSSPLPLESQAAEVDSTVDSTAVREAKALPVPGLGQARLLKQQVGINPFLQNSLQRLGMQQVGTHIKPPGGLSHQQLGVTPGAGGLINQQSGIKPVVGSPLQGGLINQQSGIKPVVGSPLQGGLINQQSGIKPVVGSPLQGGLINQQSGIKPVVGSPLQGGLINQQQVGMKPFPQGTQQHQTPSGVQISGGLVDQQTKVLPVDSQVHVTDTVTGIATDTISSKNSEVHAEDSLIEKPIEILSQNSDVNPDGSHFNVWESANGIKVQEEGTVKVNGDVEIQSVSGSISYMDADGTPIHLTYIADENGFQPQGDHLPTPPPIPQAIARALEYIAAHPYVEEESIKEPLKTSLVKEELPIVEVA